MMTVMVSTMNPGPNIIQATRYFREAGVPDGWDWVELLSPLHLRLFAVELADALKLAAISGDETPLERLLAGWEATAELDAAPDVTASFGSVSPRRPLSEFINS